MFGWRTWVFVAVTFAVAIDTASAAVITVYTDRSAWESAVGLFNEETFDDAILNTGLSAIINNGSIDGGRLNDRLAPGEETTLSFLAPLDGFGGNWDLTPGGQGLGLDLSIELFSGGGQIFAGTINSSYSGQFFGFTSDVSFDSVIIRSGTQAGSAETYNLDNLVYSEGSASPVPEPGSIILLATGGIGLVGGAVRRRRARKTLAA